MRFRPTDLEHVLLVEPEILRDDRGHFLEVYHQAKFRSAGIDASFVQENESVSAARVLRGLHAQLRRPQGKLIRVLEGEIFDVAVDLRPGSVSFGRWTSVRLEASTSQLLWLPPGFAHGFCVLRAPARVEYKCTASYDPADEIGIVWNDPDLAIPWPVADPVLSARDSDLPRLRELRPRLEAESAAGGTSAPR